MFSPGVWNFAVAVPVTGNWADLPLVMVRTMCRSFITVVPSNAVRTSPEKILRNRSYGVALPARVKSEPNRMGVVFPLAIVVHLDYVV